MEFGLGYFPTYDGMRPGEVARMAEERGYSAIYFAEHTHIPAAETDRAPGSRCRPSTGARRPPFGRPPGVWRGCGLEPDRDAQSWHRPARPDGRHAGAGRGHEGDLDS